MFVNNSLLYPRQTIDIEKYIMYKKGDKRDFGQKWTLFYDHFIKC